MDPSGSTDENSELQQARTGDLAAFRLLVLRHQALVFGSALRLTGQRPDALELAQEVFLRLHAALPRITSPAHLMRWLSRVLLQRGEATESADIEVVADPGADFAARVVARVELRWSHRRRAVFAGGSRSRRKTGRRGLILPAAMAVAVIAALVLTLWWSGALRRSQLPELAALESVANPNVSAPVQAAPAVRGAVADAQRVTPVAAALPRTRDLYRTYTVIVMPPRHESRDPAARASLDAFYTALLGELRNAPFVGLLVPGVTAPPTDIDQPADFLLTVTSLDVATPVAGGLNFRVTDDWGGEAAASIGLPSAGIASLQGRKGAQWPVEIKVLPIGQPDSAGFTAVLRIGAEDTKLAAQQVEMLRRKVFPDVITKAQLLGRLRNDTLPASERAMALDDLLDMQHRNGGGGLEPADISAILDQSVAMRADQRAQLWRSLRRISHPDLVEPLLDSMRHDEDENVRFEALATLAANYGNESKIRAAFETAARQDPEEIVRMAARRALQSEPEWRGFVVARLEDTRLTYGERLMPLAMAARSANTPAETQAVRALLQDEQVLKPLVNLVREGWYETAEAGVIADAVNLLANARNPTASDLFVQVVQEQPAPRIEPPPKLLKPEPPQLSPEAMAWLLNHRADPRVRRILQDIADGKADAQLIATVEQLRKYEVVRPPRMPRRP